MIQQENVSHHERSALVAIDETVIARNAERVCGREINNIRVALHRMIARPARCRLHKRQIAHAHTARMLGDLLIVDGQDDIFRHPAPSGIAHFASSLSTFRRSRMTREASRICRSKSGSNGVIR